MTVDILLGHASLQIQDTPAQMAADVAKVFARAVKREYRWQTGTEANSSAAAKIIRDEAEANGFWFVRGSDMWVAVPKDLCPGLPEFEFIQVLDGVKGRFTDKGVLRASWVDPELGRITVLVSHQLTLGQAADFPAINPRIAQLVGALGRKYGAGAARVFYAGDQNEDDRRFDTFDGQPFTSAADQLGKHEGSLGSRETEVIASFDADATVKATSWDVLPDREFFLNSDHNFVEAGFRILDVTPAPVPPKEPAVADDRYDRVVFRGKTVDKYTRAALLEAERRLGYELTITQGSYNAGGVSASAGTHDGGGAVDLAKFEADRKVKVLREVGFAAWHRRPSQGPWVEHVHAILIGNEKASAGAKRQVEAYKNGRNGLANNAADDGPRVGVHVFAYPPKPPAKVSTTPNITKATDPKSTLGQVVAALKKVVSSSSDKDAKDDANQALEQIRVHVKAKHKLKAALAALKKHERKS